MSRNTKRLHLALLIAAGVMLTGYPLLDGLSAQQAPGTGGAPQILNRPDDPRLQGFRWRSIGPVAQGGRIDDVEAVEQDPTTYYLGFATGGIWKTSDNGVSWAPIFDHYETHSIGDIGIAPSDPKILYVGTGEPNNRQSSSFGMGMYKSIDAGATFTHIGLRETQSIARVVVHPKDPNTVWVAAIGHLFGPNPERGVFMTTDGGKTWNKTLFVDNDTGATDLIVDRSNPNFLLAATYQRRRSACCFVGSGPGSGLHMSTDGGKSWRKLTGNGLPTGVVGRIGLDISRSSPNVIYAQIETGLPPSQQKPPPPGAAPDAGRAGGGGGGGRGGGGRGAGGDQPQTIDPNTSGVWRSNDKGKTWSKVGNENNRPMYYSQIRVDPTNENTVYVGGQNAAKSIDGGKTWQSIQGGMGHVDNHAIWINPRDSRHVMYGNDGSLDVSWNGGETWESIRLWAVGQPYHVSVNMDRPYRVCTGLQDNGTWCGPSHVRSSPIRMWHWHRAGGGDGFQTQQDPTDGRILYSESQNGNINRYDLNTGSSGSIRPSAGGGGGGGGGFGGGGGRSNIVPPPQGNTAINFAWNSPIRLSHHNPRTVIFGGNRLFISTDRGDSWRMTQPLGKNIDYTERQIMGMMYSLPSCGRGGGGGGGGGRGGGGAAAPAGPPATNCILSRGDGVQGQEASTILEVAESPVMAGVLWVGTGDGTIQLSRDNGYTWTDVSKTVPGGTREYWISGLEASWYDAGTAYLAIDGHHQDDLKPYVFKTTDYGATWTNIAGNLPIGNVNSIRQDPKNRNLLYAAHEFGFFISLDDGKSWHKFMPNLPMVRVDEVVVHPRDNDLVLATHGRSVWIMDDISALQQMTPESLNADAKVFKPRDAVAWKPDPRNGTGAPGEKWWSGQNAPAGTAIAYFLKGAPSGDVRVTITDTASGRDVRVCRGPSQAGLNRFQWTFATDPTPEQLAAAAQGGGRGGGRGAGDPAAAQQPPPQPPPPGSQPCVSEDAGGRGGRGGGGGGGFGGGNVPPGVYRVTVAVGGKQIGSETFAVVEDVWLNK